MSLQKAIGLLQANLKKCHPFLEPRPRKTPRLFPSPATGIDSRFYWEMEKFVMIALKIPAVSSYFMSLCKSTTGVFFKTSRGEREKCLFVFACIPTFLFVVLLNYSIHLTLN